MSEENVKPSEPNALNAENVPECENVIDFSKQIIEANTEENQTAGTTRKKTCRTRHATQESRTGAKTKLTADEFDTSRMGGNMKAPTANTAIQKTNLPMTILNRLYSI